MSILLRFRLNSAGATVIKRRDPLLLTAFVPEGGGYRLNLSPARPTPAGCYCTHVSPSPGDTVQSWRNLCGGDRTVSGIRLSTQHSTTTGSGGSCICPPDRSMLNLSVTEAFCRESDVLGGGNFYPNLYFSGFTNVKLCKYPEEAVFSVLICLYPAIF